MFFLVNNDSSQRGGVATHSHKLATSNNNSRFQAEFRHTYRVLLSIHQQVAKSSSFKLYINPVEFQCPVLVSALTLSPMQSLLKTDITFSGQKNHAATTPLKPVVRMGPVTEPNPHVIPNSKCDKSLFYTIFVQRVFLSHLS